MSITANRGFPTNYSTSTVSLACDAGRQIAMRDVPPSLPYIEQSASSTRFDVLVECESGARNVAL